MEEGIRAINWDIFIPVETEDELIEQSEDFEWQEENEITVFAGLIFKGVPDDEEEVGGAEETGGAGVCPGISQPKLYIRMNSSLVHDTTLYRQR